MQRRAEFQLSIPYLPIDRLLLKEGLSDFDARITFMHLGHASQDAMADSEAIGWFCLVVEPGDEKAVKERLEKFRVETFVAMEADHVCMRRGRVKVTKGGPVIPGYVLVRCGVDWRAFKGMAQIRDVQGVLGPELKPWRIKDEVIEAFKKSVETEDTDDVDDDVIRESDAVFVTKGPWVDFHGEIVQVARNKAKVRLSVFGAECEVTMPLAYLLKL